MKKALTEQKNKYSVLANKLALSERDVTLVTAGDFCPPAKLVARQMAGIVCLVDL
jgi:hypothetical protein